MRLSTWPRASRSSPVMFAKFLPNRGNSPQVMTFRLSFVIRTGYPPQRARQSTRQGGAVRPENPPTFQTPGIDLANDAVNNSVPPESAARVHKGSRHTTNSPQAGIRARSRAYTA